jgi:NAD(P)-dependent dehydrogenase (short-subunit alcohol dehydrogenase family)
MQHYSPSRQLLQQKVILVTGAAEGIGRAVALDCARHGATVVLIDFADTDLDGIYDEIVNENCPEPASFPLDLETGSAALFAGVAATLGQEFGAIHGLVHCAAFAPYLSRIDDYEIDDWERVLRVNLTGPFLLTQACLPLLRLAPEASIIFTANRGGHQGLAYWGAYAVARFGVEGLMQVLANETDTNSSIRVNCIDPGIVRTAMRHALYPGENPAIHPLPATVTKYYLYLLGADGRDVTGQSLTVHDA